MKRLEKTKEIWKKYPLGYILENGLIMERDGQSTKTSPCGFDWEIVLEFGVQIPTL